MTSPLKLSLKNRMQGQVWRFELEIFCFHKEQDTRHNDRQGGPRQDGEILPERRVTDAALLKDDRKRIGNVIIGCEPSNLDSAS